MLFIIDYLLYIFTGFQAYYIHLSNTNIDIAYEHLCQKIENLFLHNNKKYFYVKSKWTTKNLNEFFIELNKKYPDVNIKIIKNSLLYGILLKFENLLPPKYEK
jgi:hypothetical protein